MSERLAPNPPVSYMCMWEDGPLQEAYDMLTSTSTVALTPLERERFGKLVSRQFAIPSRLIITYPRSIWVAHITGEFEDEVDDRGRLQRSRGARMIGHPHPTDKGLFVVDGVFPEIMYPVYRSVLNEIRN